MLAQYVEVEEKKHEEKPVTQVHFASDYDITDVLTQWGNWARSDAYLQRKSFNLYKKEQEERKEFLSDDDALFVDSAIRHLGNLKLSRAREEYRVLILHYYGEIKIMDDCVMIIPQSLRAIAKMLDTPVINIRSMKSSAESCLVGMLAMQSMLTGTELSVLSNIRILK